MNAHTRSVLIRALAVFESLARRTGTNYKNNEMYAMSMNLGTNHKTERRRNDWTAE